jgi:DNA-dependent RNA polymerase auxiliary subunit epsilon
MEVIRGFLLPKRVNDQPLYAKKISEEEAQELLKEYKKLIEYIIQTFIKMRKNKKII